MSANLAQFGFGMAVLSLAFPLAMLALRVLPVPKNDRAEVFWLVFNAFTHFVVEGSFLMMSLGGSTVNTNESHPLGFLWREYAKSDARWGTADTFVLAVELPTVFLAGPLCLLVIWAIVTKGQAGTRHVATIVLTTLELIGGWYTFSPEWLTGSPALDTSSWLFLYIYLWFFNGLWVLIPGIQLFRSCKAVAAGMNGSKKKA